MVLTDPHFASPKLRQDKIFEHAADVKELLTPALGHVYVCGDVEMVRTFSFRLGSFVWVLLGPLFGPIWVPKVRIR
jgi:hypothetical protein